jgi:hypothetical protein
VRWIPSRRDGQFDSSFGAGADVALAELQPLGMEEISRKRHAEKQADFSRLLERHLYSE